MVLDPSLLLDALGDGMSLAAPKFMKLGQECLGLLRINQKEAATDYLRNQLLLTLIGLRPPLPVRVVNEDFSPESPTKHLTICMGIHYIFLATWTTLS